jgi:hypothetical protein
MEQGQEIWSAGSSQLTSPPLPLDPQLWCCLPFRSRWLCGAAYSRAHCRPLRTTPQMKSPQRSHHVCVVGPAGWKRWPRPGTCCCDGLRVVPGAMRRALARSSRVRPGPMRPDGASSRSSMSSGSADMARSGRCCSGLAASEYRAGEAAGRAATSAPPPGSRQGGGKEPRRTRWNPRRADRVDLWAGHGTGVGPFKEPLPNLSVQSSPPTPRMTVQRHTVAFHESALLCERKRVSTSGPCLHPPTLSASLLMLWPGPLRIRWVGQEVKSVVVCSST